MIIDTQTFKLPFNQFVPEITEKRAIVLHFTAGATASGAFASWMATGQRVAASYIIDRQGIHTGAKVYEAFEDRFWAFHLGGQTTRETQRSTIGIEIVNWGPLRRRASDGEFYSWPGMFDRTKIPAEEVYSSDTNWRGYEHWHRYQDQQLLLLCELLHDICERHGIPKTIPGAHARAACATNVNSRQMVGIFSHQNFRRDKADVGPAFPWGVLIANGFQPTESVRDYV